MISVNWFRTLLYSLLAATLLGGIEIVLSEEVPETILCDEANCQYSPDINLRFQGGGTDFSSFEISPNTSDLVIDKVDGEINREVRGSIYNVSPNGRDLEVSLNSDNPDSQASNVVIVSDVLMDLGINVDGFPGSPGKDSDFICGENFQSGAYGDDAKNYFLNRRTNDDALSNRCDANDINWLDQNKFVCPQGFIEHGGTEVDVKRIEKKRKCTSQGIRAKCVRRTYDITCDSSQKVETSWCCDNPKNDWFSGNIDSLYMPTPEGWSCDPTKCETRLEGGKFVHKNGIINTLNWTVPEVVYDQGKQKSCFYHYEGNEPDLSWQTLVHEVPGDPASPLVRGPDTYQSTAIRYGGRPNNNHIDIPVPENTSVPLQNDQWEYTQRRYAIDTQKSTVRLRNCLGLNGSDPWDARCERYKGPAGDLYIYPVDSKNNLGKEIKVHIPEGHFKIFSHLAFNFHPGGGRDYVHYSPDNYNWYAYPVNMTAHSGYQYNGSDFNNGACNPGDFCWYWVAGDRGDLSSDALRDAIKIAGYNAQRMSDMHRIAHSGVKHCNNYTPTQIINGQPCYFNIKQYYYSASLKFYRDSCMPYYWDPDGNAGHYTTVICRKEYLQ